MDVFWQLQWLEPQRRFQVKPRDSEIGPVAHRLPLIRDEPRYDRECHARIAIREAAAFSMTASGVNGPPWADRHIGVASFVGGIKWSALET